MPIPGVSVAKLIPTRSIFFLCDVQTRFRPAIYGFNEVVDTANKMLKVAKLLHIPVLTTVQNSKALGQVVPEIDVSGLGELYLGPFEKTLFSMVIPEVEEAMKNRDIKSVILFGIESHVLFLDLTSASDHHSVSHESSQPSFSNY